MRKQDTFYYERLVNSTYGRVGEGVYTEEQAELLFARALENKGLTNTYHEQYKSSDQALMKELAKTFAINLTVMADYKVETLWLQVTRDIKEAYNLVRFYDYSIVRRKAPTVKLRYTGTDTKILNRGDSIGTYKGLDIISLDETRYLEYGDIKEFVLGHYESIEVNVETSGQMLVTLEPETLASIDNDYIFVSADGNNIPITKHITQYVRGNSLGGEGSVRDFSKDGNSTELYIKDEDKNFGAVSELEGVSKVIIRYLETDGLLVFEELETMDINDVDFKDGYLGVFNISEDIYAGYNGDTLDTLKTYAALVSTTKGEANALRHYNILTAAIPELYDTNPFKESGEGETVKYKMTNSNNPSKFTIEGEEFTLASTSVSDFKIMQESLKDVFGIDYNVSKLGDTEFSIKTTNYKYVNNVQIGSNLTELSREDGVEPQCCTLMCPYVRNNYALGIDNHRVLNTIEKGKVESQTALFKAWGATVMYYPAKEKVLNIEVSVMPSSNQEDLTDLEDKIRDVFKSYEYKIGSSLSMPEVVVRVSNIRIFHQTLGDVPAVDMCSTKVGEEQTIYANERDTFFKINPIIKFTEWSY